MWLASPSLSVLVHFVAAMPGPSPDNGDQPNVVGHHDGGRLRRRFGFDDVDSINQRRWTGRTEQ